MPSLSSCAGYALWSIWDSGGVINTFCQFFNDVGLILGAIGGKKHCKSTFGAPEGPKLTNVAKIDASGTQKDHFTHPFGHHFGITFGHMFVLVSALISALLFGWLRDDFWMDFGVILGPILESCSILLRNAANLENCNLSGAKT